MISLFYVSAESHARTSIPGHRGSFSFKFGFWFDLQFCAEPVEGEIPNLEGNQSSGTFFHNLILQLEVRKSEKAV